MSETLKNIVLSLLMGLGTVVAIMAGFALLVVVLCGLVIATQTHPIITIVGWLVVSSAYLAVVYYNKKFK